MPHRRDRERCTAGDMGQVENTLVSGVSECLLLRRGSPVHSPRTVGRIWRAPATELRDPAQPSGRHVVDKTAHLISVKQERAGLIRFID
jgi:hypothetical protein